MIKRRLAIVLCIFSIYGCNSTKVAENAELLDVNFEWTKVSVCSSISPAILITNIPQETKFLKVEMVDLDMPMYDHGGGEVVYAGSDIISEGSLKSYSGPCPPAGVEHSYEITVPPLNPAKKLILGQGKKMKKFKMER